MSKSLPKGLEHDQYSSEDLQKYTPNVLDADYHGPQGVLLSTGAFERKAKNADLYRPKAKLKNRRSKRQISKFNYPKKPIFQGFREPETVVNGMVSAKDPAMTDLEPRHLQLRPQCLQVSDQNMIFQSLVSLIE